MRAVWISIAAVGAAMIVFLVALWPRASRAFGVRPVRWLGSISFSLYLVQEPIVVAVAVLARGRLSWWLLLPICLVVSAVVAWGFHRLVEAPSQRLAQAVGRRFTRRSTAVEEPAVAPALAGTAGSV